MPEKKQPTREEFVKSLFLMDKEDNIHTGESARKRLIKGIDKVVDAIKPSYGSAGSNTIIEESVYPYTRTSNDGKVQVEAIVLADKLENMGANIAKETADKSDRMSGDGRKTSLILLQSIIREGMKSKLSPMELKRSLDECLPIIHKAIDEQTKPITADDDVGMIATIASESESLGQTFQEIYQIIGKDGIVELANSNLPTTFYEITEGVRLHGAGYGYAYMCNDEKQTSATYYNPKILITKEKLSSVVVMDSLLKVLSKDGINELVIFADEVDLAVSQVLAQAHISGAFKTLVIKAPTLWKDWIYEDFAKLTGATIINPAEGTSLKSFSKSWLGTCERLETTKEETIIRGGQDLSQHIENLSSQNTDEAKIRVARLQTKTAILKLGANSESELSYIRGKALDARNASYLALNHGVVKGAGMALYNITLPKTEGGKILAKAIQAPFDLIKENLGVDTLKIGKDILDPAIVVKNSLTNALSVASTILTVRNVITK